MIKQEILKRKGARKALDIPTEVLALLNKGETETVNLTEWLAVDHTELINNNFSDIGIPDKLSTEIIEKIKSQKKPSTMNTIKLTGAALYEFYAGKDSLDEVFWHLSRHNSDSIRCYAPYLIALNDQLSIDEKLTRSQKLVADTHFGVREVVWMALRPEIESDLEISITILSRWAENEDGNIRRFATESIRPRGVWCKHIETLKEKPELALAVLEKLKSDPSRYVQDSVGNWLNDAGKTRPDFVTELCERWEKESSCIETQKIIRKALRSIEI